MRRIERLALEPATTATLDELTKNVVDGEDRKAKAQRLWNAKASSKKGKAAFDDVRKVLEAMATGRGRCMYCEDSYGTDIEHFYPKASYPEKAFTWENYLLACSHCNSNRKREKFPLQDDGSPALIDPTADDPIEHLVLLPSNGKFRAIGPKGQPSIDVFGLNDTKNARNLPESRQGTLIKLQVLLKEYEECCSRGNEAQASLIKRTIENEPFSAVRVWLVSIARRATATRVLDARIVEIIRRRGVADW